MKNKKIIAAILSLLITTQPAFAAGAIYVGTYDHESGRKFARVFANLNYETVRAADRAAYSSCIGARAPGAVDDGTRYSGTLRPSDCAAAATFENTCFAAIIGQETATRDQQAYWHIDDSQSNAISMARAACDRQHSTCGGEISGCDTISSSSDDSTSPPTNTAPPPTNTSPPPTDGFPDAITPSNPPQEVGQDISGVSVRGLGLISRVAVQNLSANAITYNAGDYLEPRDGDFQRMIITQRVAVAAGQLAEIPVACRQVRKSIPATGATFYSMPSTLQSDENSACQARCLDGTDVQSCVWACETNARADEEFAASSTNTGGSSGGGSSSSTGLIVGGVAVVGGLIWLLSSGGEEGEFNFSHDFGYSATESGYSANIGGQMDFRKDSWHLYYSADSGYDGNGMQEFRYQSGGSYTADFWTAEFSESVSGKTADYDLSLSSDFGSGIWKLSPTYRLHSEYSDSEFDTQNSLNLESEFRYNNWQIRPTAGFNWREFGEFADSGTFRINAVHRF